MTAEQVASQVVDVDALEIDALEFDGEPFDPTRWSADTIRADAPPQPRPSAAGHGGAGSVGSAGASDLSSGPADRDADGTGFVRRPSAPVGSPSVPAGELEPAELAASIARQVRAVVVAAHASALRAQTSVQNRVLAALAASGQPASPANPAGSASLVSPADNAVRPAGGLSAAAPAPGISAGLARPQPVSPAPAPTVPGVQAGPVRAALPVAREGGVPRGAQQGLQRDDAAAPAPAVTEVFEVVDGRPSVLSRPSVAPAPTRVSTEAAFKPLARSDRNRLDAADLTRLAEGSIASVFGAAYDQDGANPSIRLALPRAGVPGLLLSWVDGLDVRGGAWGHGALRAGLRPGAVAAGPPAQAGPDQGVQAQGVQSQGTPAGEQAVLLAESAAQAAEVFALYLGLHLGFADATFARGVPGGPDAPGEPDRCQVEILGPTPDADVELALEVTGVDLVPRPWLSVDAEFRVGGEVVARVRGVTLGVQEKPGVPIGPQAGGTVARFLGRRNSLGEPVMLNEFHMAHCSKGDPGIALGPEFSRYRGIRATRLPDGGLRLVDRIVAVQGERGKRESLRGGATHQTEYDSPAGSWYYQDTANASMPNCVYMETSLQSALVLGYYLGATLTDLGGEHSLRNLGGTAMLLREVDLRNRTLRQHSTLLSTTPMPGSVLQEFSYRFSVDGEPVYEGESMFGYFNEAALARQSGLDAGRLVPTWLDEQQPRPPVRTIDVAARRADPSAPLCSRGHLALLDDVEVVDGGGRYGQGYLRAARPIDPHDWFFARHFVLDPVIPGSLGVEAVIQAIQEWLVDGGHTAGFARPGFVLPVGLPMTWKYRGQFLSTDSETTLEVHVKSVERRPGRVRVVADASVWKPTMRIYELTDVAVELRDEGAPPW
ncbi:beta-ketoacyl synthase [Protofrankia coriariae]|uniref:Beta-ketoacyl synthase n=1 Tax=Protofrankia coriariae TaxID=1562887 RepID=A0ABR5F659_9ACTN|nr:beta-ketoacyl synthase [Protofrankia coriariae]KLL12148.1 beta-ketoacyl synthase [Protofrankia coriariae]